MLTPKLGGPRSSWGLQTAFQEEDEMDIEDEGCSEGVDEEDEGSDGSNIATCALSVSWVLVGLFIEGEKWLDFVWFAWNRCSTLLRKS